MKNFFLTQQDVYFTKIMQQKKIGHNARSEENDFLFL